MSYKDLRRLKEKTDIWDNESGHFLQKCPFCKSIEMQIDARNNRGICHNRKCKMGKRWLSTKVIEEACRKLL